ncbi:hypothetical protein QPK24_01345 [Paenibacillus polygoni]|uniref:SMI1/KNR4 family protein n=1 Tax=Paenibacillus polygoni TaxID=3050112 RepID=A0ABY8X8D2_9BACL|nr:hypothetical protein [Paenibacillus polygoni]WIV19450.1 hypothetical protein QPK24_01345 [Paenibacillus polygoni]
MKEQDEAIRMNFGKYEIPSDLKRLMELDQWHEIKGNMKVLDSTIGLIPEIGGFRYYCTPCDVVVFGSNGCDGIHYGFLTDFGTVDNLDEAPIVCISPMDFGHTNRLIARNFRDFLSIHLDNSELFYNDFESEAAYLKQVTEWKREEEESPYRDTPEEKQYAEEIKTMLRTTFELPVIDRPYEYIRTLQEERRRQACVLTRESLHIVLPNKFGIATEDEKQWLEQIESRDEAAVQAFLEKASLPAVLGIAREVGAQADHPSLLIVERFLENHGFHDEAVRLRYQLPSLELSNPLEKAEFTSLVIVGGDHIIEEE